MEFTYIADGIDAIVIDNFYTDEEYQQILNEQIALIPELKDPSKTAGAISVDGKSIVKENRGIFIANEDKFNIININYLKFNSDQLKTDLVRLNPLYKIFNDCNDASTLLSYYDNGDHYATHIDASVFTIIVYVNKQEKKFSGGELTLYSCNDKKYITVEPKNNRVVIFPSCTPHKVSEVTKLDTFDYTAGDGRFCISHFLSKKDPRTI